MKFKVIPPPHQENAPLSAAQERLWLLEQLTPGHPVYRLSTAFRLRGKLDHSVLQRSIAEIIHRHEALRATFHSTDGQLVQTFPPATSFILPIVNLEKLPRTERENEIQRLALGEAGVALDLTRHPPVRATLARLEAENHVLLITVHRLAADDESLNPFVRELAVLYESFLASKPSPLPEPRVPSSTFASQQREWLKSGASRARIEFWKKRLEGAPAMLELPMMGRARPAKPSYRGGRQRVSFDLPATEALKRFSQGRECCLEATCLAAFTILLARYANRNDIVIGCDDDYRTSKTIWKGTPSQDGILGIGNFANTLVLRMALEDDPSFDQLAHRVQSVLAEARENATPFEKLIDELKPPRDPSYNPLVQVCFGFTQEAPAIHLATGLTITPFEIDSQTTFTDLGLHLKEAAHGIEGWIDYAADLFDAEAISRMAGHLGVLVQAALENPNQPFSRLALLTEAERQPLLFTWNKTNAPFGQDKCLHQLFQEQAERTPEAVALIFGREQVTYRELNERANRLANHLRYLGVGPEVLVGIFTERNIEVAVGLMAVLKAGGAYVPLDPAYPADRVAFILEDSNAPVLLTQKKLQDRLPKHHAKPVWLDEPGSWEGVPETNNDLERRVSLSSLGGEGRGEEGVRQKPVNGPVNVPHVATGFLLPTPHNLAYIIYTSGSTGRPKGVAIEHHSVVNFVEWARTIFSSSELAGVLASTSICFDLSVFELFVTLSAGGKVILAENALQLPELPAAWQVTLINTVPSAIAELVRAAAIPPSVSTVNLAGEPLETALAARIYQQGSVSKVYDLYGPSESTTYSTFTLRAKDGPATIGRPIANTRVYLLDDHLQPVPLGLPGDLYIAGEGLARGYLNKPELTAEKFIPDPFDSRPGARLYKTGDLAKYSPDGNIEFLGRKDNQVKIRGFRIELGEIEMVLRQHPGLQAAVVTAREDGPGGKRLVAYVVKSAPSSNAKEFAGTAPVAGDETNQSLVAVVRAWLKTKLPDYMVPAAFVVLPALPLTPNGKVDRKALPPPEQGRPEKTAAFASPRTSTEQVLCEIWCEVLGLDECGIHDNFFELGGHSLLAVQVIARLREKAQVELSIRHFFDLPTVASLAQVVESHLIEEIGQLSEDEARQLMSPTHLTK